MALYNPSTKFMPSHRAPFERQSDGFPNSSPDTMLNTMFITMFAMLPDVPHKLPPPTLVSRRSALIFFATSACATTVCAANAQAADTAGRPGKSNATPTDTTAAGLLRAGGCVLLLRHAATDPGVGDPPEFSLGDCRTQRNLSPAGRQDAKRIGAWFASRKLTPQKVLSSAWCRCKDTADLSFGRHEVWAALNSIFGDRVQRPDQSAQSDQTGLLRQAMARVPARQFEVWVTHQVNISAIAGQGVAMGEALIVDRAGRVLARTGFE